MFKKLLLAGVVSAAIALGVVGIGTASADGGHDNDWNNPCIVDGTYAVNPACWQGVIWGGPARGWIPQYGYFNNAYGPFWATYYFLNFYNPYLYNPYNYNNYGCWDGQNGHWYNGVWYACYTTQGHWSNGTWYPY